MNLRGEAVLGFPGFLLVSPSLRSLAAPLPSSHRFLFKYSSPGPPTRKPTDPRYEWQDLDDTAAAPGQDLIHPGTCAPSQVLPLVPTCRSGLHVHPRDRCSHYFFHTLLARHSFGTGFVPFSIQSEEDSWPRRRCTLNSFPYRLKDVS